MKRMSLLFTGVILVIGLCIWVTNAPSTQEKDKSNPAAMEITQKLKYEYESSDMYEVSEPLYEHEAPSVRRTIYVVYVTSPCDDEWRSQYASYMYEAGRTVERADDELYNEFGIDLYSVAQFPWSSSSTTSSGLLNEAYSEHGLTYNGNQTAEMMIAFSGVTPSDNSNITGVAYVGLPYLVVFDNGYSMNSETLQHECGHTYGLNHCESEAGSSYGDSACVMTAYGFGNIDQFCTGHYAEWANCANTY